MDRMSPLDAVLLELESDTTPMHVGSVALVEGPMPAPADLAIWIESRVNRVPRLRQLVRRVPGGLARPIWADDPNFRLHQHLRRETLLAPGGSELLRTLIGRVLAEPLDPTRPLWELCTIDGLTTGKWALVTKVHHSMVDGIAGSDLLTRLLDDSSDAAHQPRPLWHPATPASRGRLVRDAVGDLARAPLAAASGVRALAGALTTTGTARARMTGLTGPNGFIGLARRPRPSVPGLTGEIGPNRSWGWTEQSVEAVDRIRGSLGGTINDVVLAAITRGFRELLLAREMSLTGLHVRSLVPVSVRGKDEHGGNRATGVLVDLPVGEADPLARYAQLRAQMHQLKTSGQARDADAVLDLLAAVPAPLTSLGFRSVFTWAQPFIQT